MAVLQDLSQNAMLEMLAKLQAENALLKANQKSNGNGMKVSEKGALSVYGMGRFPVTLYKSQWKALLARKEAIEAFIEAHDGELREKD
jgi:hypothetical protein